MFVFVFIFLFVENDFFEIEFLKKGDFFMKELDVVISLFVIVSGLDLNDCKCKVLLKEKLLYIRVKKIKFLEGLEDMGVKIYGLESSEVGDMELSDCILWDIIVGYYD